MSTNGRLRRRWRSAGLLRPWRPVRVCGIEPVAPLTATASAVAGAGFRPRRTQPLRSRKTAGAPVEVGVGRSFRQSAIAYAEERASRGDACDFQADDMCIENV